VTDVDPEREWYYSITAHYSIHDRAHLRGVIRQGDASTRQELVGMVLTAHRFDPYTTYADVHSIERNDL
jgi:hypothetical protein